MSVQHTPGPWKLTVTGGDVMTRGESDVLVGNGELWIARLFHPDSHVPGTTSLAPPPDQVKANAFLIKVAPDLLAMCEEAVTAFENLLRGSGKACYCGVEKGACTLCKLRAAIARAGGQS